MKVLTVKTLEKLPPETQRDVHYILRMEHQSDYIFRDQEASQYSATVSIDDPEEVIRVITEKSSEIPEYTLMVYVLDIEENKAEHWLIKAGKIEEKKSGNWEWNA